ncbi:MAG TPA: hypothetical protein VIN59_07335 [Alphaproteobacteria bacterium]
MKKNSIWHDAAKLKLAQLADGRKSANEIADAMTRFFQEIGDVYSRDAVIGYIRRTNKKLTKNNQPLLKLSDSKGGFYEGHKHSHKVPVREQRSKNKNKPMDALGEFTDVFIADDMRPSPWRFTLARMPQPVRPSFQLPIEEAAQKLVTLFARTALYEAFMPNYSACHYNVGGHSCGLLVEEGVKDCRCAFHKAVGQYGALELTAFDVYLGSPLLESTFRPVAYAQKSEVLQLV